jgi:hypothetical protein
MPRPSTAFFGQPILIIRTVVSVGITEKINPSKQNININKQQPTTKQNGMFYE